MEWLHQQLRRGREKAGLSQQALAKLAGIPRNQIVRAEQGENITLDTLRKIVPHLPLSELTLMDTKGLRIDIVAEPEKLFIAALENVLLQSDAMLGAIRLAMEAFRAVDLARRADPLQGEEDEALNLQALFFLRALEKLAGEVQRLGNNAKNASQPPDSEEVRREGVPLATDEKSLKTEEKKVPR